MKFDLLFSKIINEATPERKAYYVEFSRRAKDIYNLKDSTTTARSKKQAISMVISSQIKAPREQLKLIIWKVMNEYGARAKEKTYSQPATKVEEIPQSEDEQLNLSFESFDKEKKEGLHGWFSRNHGKGWVNCKSSKPGHIVPCGRKKGSKGGKGYPACRPTLSMCSGSKAKKKSHTAIKWKKKK